MALSDNLIAYYSLDEASGNAIDAHGSNDLTETGGTIASTTGKVGNCRDFEADDTEQFELADNAALSTGDIDFTIACWVKVEAGSGTVFPVAVSKHSATAAQREYLLYFDTTANRFALAVYVSTSQIDVVANNFGAVSQDTWYHLVAWHDSVNDLIGISVNAGTADTTLHSGGVNDGNAAFQIGAASAASLHWDGLIDEVGFWKRKLTAEEITWLYNGGAGRSYADIVAGMGGGGGAARHYYAQQ